MFSFKAIELKNIDKYEYYDFPNKSLYTTLPWINFLIEDNPNAQIIILRITQNDRFVGYFTGMQFKKFGIGIVGSPFRGWSTSFMGLDLIAYINRASVLSELTEYLFKTYSCRYIQIIDRNFEHDQVENTTAIVSSIHTLELDINRSDEELLKIFKPDCRNFIKQFERKGATIEVVEPNAAFAAEFYQQLKDVFEKQGMIPTYSEKKVERLIRCLAKEEMVLCLRVCDPNGNPIASSIFPGYGNKCFYWGGASYRSTQYFRPNEYMIWTAIRYWRDKGVQIMDMQGDREYKKKFGPERMTYYQIELAKPLSIIFAKNVAENIFFISLHVRERLSRGFKKL